MTTRAAGRLLKKARQPLSLAKYAQVLGTSRGFLWRVEQGEQRPSVSTAVQWEQRSGLTGLTLLLYPELNEVVRQK